jgi:hypothetical protein
MARGWTSENGYFRFRVNGRQVYAHKHKYESRFGLLLPGFILHHKDENKQNNTLKNLTPMWLGAHTALHNRERRNNEKRRAD